MKYDTLKALVNAKVYENTEQRITGGDMNTVLQSAIASLGAHYQMGGLVSPTDHITVGDEPVVFIATTPGTYTYFGSQVVADGEVALLVWSGTAWSKQTPDIATRTEVSQLGQKVFNLDKNNFEYITKANVSPDSSAVILPYLGFCNCNFTISGINQQSFQITGKNKATGVIVSLYQATTPVDLPVSFDNPRPDLELIDITINGYSTIIDEQLTITITKGNPIEALNTTTAQLSENQAQLGKVITIGNIDAVFAIEGLIIRTDGTSQASSSFFSSTPIFLERGDSISFRGSVSSVAAMLSESTYNGSFVRTLIVGENVIKERTYIAEHSMYVRICCSQQSFTAQINKLSTREFTEINIQHKFEYAQQASGQAVRPYKILKGHTYKVVNTSATPGVAMNLRSRKTESGANIDEIATGLDSWVKDNYVLYTATEDAEYIWSFLNAGGSYEIEDVTSIVYRLNELEKRRIIKNIQVRYDFEKPLKDVSSIFAEFDFADKMYQADILEQLNSKFLDLLDTYPNLITRFDAVNFANGGSMQLSYPEYANGIETEGTYKVTPAYKTYLWKISCADTTLTGDGARPKKKIFLIGGTHGNEKFAMYNLYAFAKLLVSCADSNYYKLLASCDFYILPCLNGYGAYHTMRGNANNVNINRNYPTWGWTRNNPDAPSRYDDLLCDYTGDYAGSEFETQLVIGCANRIIPDLMIDHHNYGEESSVQFYTEYGNDDNQNLVNQCAIDLWQQLVANMPSYFGAGYGVNLLSDINETISYTTTRWATENNFVAYTIEVGHSINYNNGSVITTNKESFTANVAKIAEYTLRQQLLVYISEIMK